MTADTVTAATPPAILPEIKHLAEPVDSLHPFPGNPRVHADAEIEESLRVNGQYRPIVCNTGSLTGRPREVLAGHGTLAAMQRLGAAEIAVTWVDVDDVGARRINAADNRLNDLAGYNDRALAGLLEPLPSLEGTGYDAEWLAALVQSIAEPDFSPDFADLPRLDRRTEITCPSCGASFEPKG